MTVKESDARRVLIRLQTVQQAGTTARAPEVRVSVSFVIVLAVKSK